MKMETKFFYESTIRKLLIRFNNAEISFGKMVELMNEEVEKHLLVSGYKQIKTKEKNPSGAGWYDTDKGRLYYFFVDDKWSCREDRHSDEYPSLWYAKETK